MPGIEQQPKADTSDKMIASLLMLPPDLLQMCVEYAIEHKDEDRTLSNYREKQPLKGRQTKQRQKVPPYRPAFDGLRKLICLRT